MLDLKQLIQSDFANNKYSSNNFIHKANIYRNANIYLNESGPGVSEYL
jgi:hypothetical protein